MNNAWRESVEAWVAHLRAGGHPPTTIRLRTQHVRQLSAAHEDPWSLTTESLVRWMAGHEWAPATAYSVRCSLRAFYGWAVASGRAATNPAAGLPQVRRRPPRPHPLADDILEAVLRRADEREWLILNLAGRCGLRRAEIAQVRGQDVHGYPGQWSLVVNGKGQRARVVPMPDDLAQRVLAGGRSWTFPGNDGGHLSPQWVGEMISRMLPHGWSLHSLRHRFATRAYAATRDAFAVQRLLGHASPATTLAYVQVPDDSLRAAMLAAS